MADYSVTTNTLQEATLLQGTQFKVILKRERFPNVEFFAQSVSHPSVDMSPATVPFRSADTFQPGDKLTFGDLTIDALIDENMVVYKEIHEWMEQLVNKNIKPNDLNYLKDDKTTYDLRLLILNSNNNVVREIVYKDSFPISLGNVMFQANAGDIMPIIAPITFRYTMFEFI